MSFIVLEEKVISIIIKSIQIYFELFVNKSIKGRKMLKYVKQLTSLVAVIAILFTFTTEVMAAKKSKTLKNTIKKGFVRCGVSQGLPGFSNADASGNWTGVDVDVCRAVAAAVLGDANKVKFTPLSAKERFTALTAGEIDILSRNTTWTLVS